MAYRVNDIDATCAHLRERGVRLLYEEPRRGTAEPPTSPHGAAPHTSHREPTARIL